MKAIVMTATGGPEVLQLQDVATPILSGERDLLIRIKAAGVNPVDTKLRARGTYFPERMPTVLGCDGAGVVEAIGSDVQLYQPGDAVYFCNGGIGAHPGTYAEYTVIDERLVAPKPRTLSFAEAAAAPLVLITAWEALHDRAHVQEGQHVLVHAGAGGVGHVAIQLAKLGGARVCTTVSSAEKIELTRSIGADETIDYLRQDFADAANAWSGGLGVDVVLDTVGGNTFARSVYALRYAGDLVSLLQPGNDMDWKEARLRNLRVSLELMLSPMLYGLFAQQQHQAEILRRCGTLFDAGKLRIHLAHTFPLKQAGDAHRMIEAGNTTGKIALIVSDWAVPTKRASLLGNHVANNYTQFYSN